MKITVPGLHALAALLLVSGTAQAAITVYTSQASSRAAGRRRSLNPP
ncbi:MAG: hypothetical protein ACK52M_10410 [bacterium]|jgi:hypothetical protein|nr:hypothetical protein [Betaproteobacteria bacterium]